MIEVYPNYYDKFRCIADRCKHNCCIGWEIDIDDDTMKLYNALDTPFGEKIRANITGDIPHFILKDGDRCPFLNKNGLCDIISEYGEDGICDICYLHPRFKNFFTYFEETGLGLCCEEACRIILTEKEKFSIDTPNETVLSKEEVEFLKIRQQIFSVLTNREKSIFNRFSELAEKFGLRFDFSLNTLYESYLSLERLDVSWTKELERLADFSFDKKVFLKKEMQLLFEQLGVYFIFRHLTGAFSDGNYESKVKFALLSCYIIGALFQSYKYIELEKMVDIVRMYSAEIEYCEENINSVMEML